MSKLNEEGGPAFPLYDTHTHLKEEGMSLRDYLAAHALEGLLARGHIVESSVDWAYQAADAALIRRKKKSTPAQK